MRAAMSACRVSGTRSDEPLPDPLSTSMRMVSSTKSGLPSARSIASCGSAVGRSPDGTGELAQQLLDELGALVLRERLELDRRRAHAASSPPGTRVEQLGTREAEDEDRRANPVGDVLDEVEERRLCPVDVLEEQDQRLDVGDSLHHLARRPGDLLRAALALERLHEPGRKPENVGNRVLGAALAELLERLLERDRRPRYRPPPSPSPPAAST